MTRLTVLFGIPGSGKSTWAASQAQDVLSYDPIRERGLEGIVARNFCNTLETIAQIKLLGDTDVIIDGCHLNPKHRARWLGIGAEAYLTCELKVFPCDLETALERQKGRDHPVPDDVVGRYEQAFDTQLAAVRREKWDSIS